MPQLDNRYPLTYDGVDPLTILPSLNPYEGYPIKRTSSAVDLSVVAIIRGEDEHPYLSSIPATPLLHKGAYSSGVKTGFFLPKSSSPIGYITNNTLYGNGARLPAIMSSVPPNYSSGGLGVIAGASSSDDSTYGVGAGSVLASLDDVFYSIYIKDYAAIQSDAAVGATGIYSVPNSFLGLYSGYVGPFPTPTASAYTIANTNTVKTLFGYTDPTGQTPGFGSYSKWSSGSTFFRNTTKNSIALGENQKYGAIEGWHTVPVQHYLYYQVKTTTGLYWMTPPPVGVGYINTERTHYKDKFSYIGTSDPLAPEATTYGWEPSSSWMLFSYAMPQRPATALSVYRVNSIGTYVADALNLDNPSLNGETGVSTAKEVSVSPNGKILMLATDIGEQASFPAFPRVSKETIIMFRLAYALGAYRWRNAYLMTGLPPATSSSSQVNAEFTPIQGGSISANPITASFDNVLAYGQFNTAAVSDSADWVIGNNFGWTNKAGSTGTNSQVETDLKDIYPAAARAVSKNTLSVATPTTGTEYGKAGSPTIAMAVSDNGVVVKSDRVVGGRLNAVRIPITGITGGGLGTGFTLGTIDPAVMTYINANNRAAYYTGLNSTPVYHPALTITATIDIDEGGTPPTTKPFTIYSSAYGWQVTGGTGGANSKIPLNARLRFTDSLGVPLVGYEDVYVVELTNSGNGDYVVLANSSISDPPLPNENVIPVIGGSVPSNPFYLQYANPVVGKKFEIFATASGGVYGNTADIYLDGKRVPWLSAGTNAYLTIHMSNKAGTYYEKSFLSYENEYWDSRTYTFLPHKRYDGQPVKRNSAHNIKSYQESLYANVTIGGQAVIPASPITLSNALFGPFGACVAINAEGDTAAVSSPSEGYVENTLSAPACEGAVYIYRKGGNNWEQVNRITVPRVADYFGGPTGSVPHAQFGSSLEFSGGNLLIGSRQGVYIYEMVIGFFAGLSSSTAITADLTYDLSAINVLANATTSTRFQAILSGTKVDLSQAIVMSSRIGADLENPTIALVEAAISTRTKFAANLTFASKMTINARLELGSTIVSTLSLLVESLNSGISGRSTISANVAGPIGFECEINLGGKYAGTLVKSYVIPAQLNMLSSLRITDDLFRINPLKVEASTYTSTAIAAQLGYANIELAAILKNATSVELSVARLTLLGTSDPRQASIFEVGRASSGTIGGLGQRWVKRSDLQNSDLTTSVEWVEGEPPQLD